MRQIHDRTCCLLLQASDIQLNWLCSVNWLAPLAGSTSARLSKSKLPKRQTEILHISVRDYTGNGEARLLEKSEQHSVVLRDGFQQDVTCDSDRLITLLRNAAGQSATCDIKPDRHDPDQNTHTRIRVRPTTVGFRALV